MLHEHIPLHIRLASPAGSLMHLLNWPDDPEPPKKQNTQSQPPPEPLSQEKSNVPEKPILIPVLKTLHGVIDESELLTCDVHANNFVPKEYWSRQKHHWLVRDLVTVYFRSRTSKFARFPFKLANALKITTWRPELFRVIGVKWVSPTVIMVNKTIFARLLGVKKATTAIFSSQGTFPTHNFVEIPIPYMSQVTTTDSNYTPGDCKFFTRLDRKFTTTSTEQDMEACRYIPPNR